MRKFLFLRNYSYKQVRRPEISLNRKLTAPQLEQKQAPNLTKQIQQKILATGPITVAEYMREVLTNPSAGYYMYRDVFGRDGDFITSPEISQIFGELIGIWILSEWRKIGSPTPFQIVELGPGRGTLMRDVLKVLTKFKLTGQFSMHLVELSPFLSKIQAQSFCYTHNEITDEASLHYQMGKTATGTNAYWYKCLEDVPQEFSIVLAHEFFDALPVHKLQFDQGVWKEVLIDVLEDHEEEKEDFRLVLSKAPTPVSRIFQPIDGETRTCLEYSVEANRIIEILAQRFEQFGGIGLIMDYGHFGDKTDTFRAFKKHKLHNPLKEPGSADLTADVDFRQIKHVAEKSNQVFCCGPVTQEFFLKQMHGDARLQQLLENALPENQDLIKSGYNMLTHPDEMGTRFKFLSMFPNVLMEHLTKFPVHGFH